MRLQSILTLFFALLCVKVSGTVLDKSRQLLVVTTSDWDAVQGTLQRYERTKPRASWIAVGPSIPVVVGKKGMGWGIGIHSPSKLPGPIKKEGDLKSPAGLFLLGPAFGHTAQKLKIDYTQITPTMEAVDDVHSKYYNQIVDRKNIDQVDWNSSEKMYEIPLYNLGLVVQHNTSKPIPGAGSAIFMHIWRTSDQGTGGCTAMRREDLDLLLHWLDLSASPILAQFPQPIYNKLQQRWSLPKKSMD